MNEAWYEKVPEVTKKASFMDLRTGVALVRSNLSLFLNNSVVEWSAANCLIIVLNPT